METELYPTFDKNFSHEEKLPKMFEIEILKLTTGEYRLRWNGVFIGGTLVKKRV